MDKTDYFDKIDALVNDKQTYKELGLDPASALQRKLNSKILKVNFRLRRRLHSSQPKGSRSSFGIP